MADSTYRRARATLLDCGELVLAAAGGGRARTNRWTIPDPRSINANPVAAARPWSAPGLRARPLLATARLQRPALEEQLDLAIGADETAVGERKGPELSGVTALNPGQNRTVCAATPPQTPPETPPPNARTGGEPQNPRISKDPPSPPEGGGRQLVSIVEEYLTPQGRRRHRTVTVDLDEIRSQLLSPSLNDRADWQQIRADLQATIGGSMFTIWLAALQLIGRDDGNTLLLTCPTMTRQWVAGRYAAVLERIGRCTAEVHGWPPIANCNSSMPLPPPAPRRRPMSHSPTTTLSNGWARESGRSLGAESGGCRGLHQSVYA